MAGMRYQPQGITRIAAGNALSKGLEAYFTPFSGRTSPVGGAYRRSSPHGIGFSTTASGDSWSAGAGTASKSPTWTILSVLCGTSTNSNTGGYALYAERPNDTQIVKLGVGDGGTQSALLVVRDTGGNLVLLRGSSNVNADAGRPRVIVGTRRSANDHRLYVDGRYDAGSNAWAGGTFGGTNAVIGNDLRDPASYLVGASTLLVLVWNRSLTDAEIAQVSANPWQLFDDGSNEDEENLFARAVATMLVSRDFNAAYDVRGTVASNLAPSYAVRNVVATDVSADCRVLNATAANLLLDYRVLAAVAASLAPGYSVYGTASNMLSADYQVLSSVSVTTSLALAYRIFEAAGSTLTPNYAVRSAVNKDLASDFATRAAAGQSLSPAYSVRSAAGQDLSPAYTVRSAAGLDLSPTYSVRAAIARELAPAYVVRGTVNKELAAVYAIIGGIRSDLLGVYRILGTVVSAPLRNTVTFTEVHALEVEFEARSLIAAPEARNLIATFEATNNIVEFIDD